MSIDPHPRDKIGFAREEPPIIALINELLRGIDALPPIVGLAGFIFTPGQAQVNFFRPGKSQPLDSRGSRAILTRLKIMAGIEITEPAPQIGRIFIDGQDVEEDQYFLVQTWPTVLGEEMMIRRISNNHPSFPINNLLGEAMVLNPPRIERPKNGGIEVFERKDDDTSLGAELLDVLSDPRVEFEPAEGEICVPEQKPLPITSLVRPIVVVLSLIFVTATGILLVSKFFPH